MENIAVEASYVDYGTVSTRSTVTVPGPGTFNIDMDVTAWVIDAVGIMPVGEGFELFGKAGVALWESDANFSAAGAGGAFSGNAGDDGNDFHFGLGAGYALTENLGVRGEWERVNNEDSLDVRSVGAQFTF